MSSVCTSHDGQARLSTVTTASSQQTQPAVKIYQITFAAVAAPGSGDLSEVARDLNLIRQGRHTAVSDWRATTIPAQLADLHNATTRLLREAFSWFQEQRP
jgi:hypothetical protein